MNVQEVMTKAPRTCRGSDSLTTAAKVLWDHDCGSVPVVDDQGRPVGIVTDRDCCMASYTRGARLDEVRVADAMARVVYTVRADEPIAQAMATMKKHQVRRLPVVDGAGRLCGILSSADLAVRARGVAAIASGFLETMAAIAAPRNAATVSAPARTEPAAVVVPKAPAAGGGAAPGVIASGTAASGASATSGSASTGNGGGGGGKGKVRGKKK